MMYIDVWLLIKNPFNERQGNGYDLTNWIIDFFNTISEIKKETMFNNV